LTVHIIVALKSGYVGHSMSLKLIPLESLGTVSYPCLTMAVYSRL